MKVMNDLIYGYLLDEKRGLSDSEIIERFYKMGQIDELVARRIVEPLLGRDRRFVREGPLWKAVRLSSVEELPVWDTPYLLFAIDEIAQQGIGVRDAATVLNRFASFVLFRSAEAKDPPPVASILEECHRYVFLPHDMKSLNRLKRIYRMHSPLAFEAKILSLRRLLAHFYPEKKYTTWDDIIRDFSILNYEGSGTVSKTKTMALVFHHLLRTAQERGVQTSGELIEISNRIEPSVDFSRYGFDREFMRQLPEKPGVYLFKNRDGQVVYVGKTRNLRERVGSYFRQTGESEEKRELIRQHLYSISYRELGSDLEALIEEYRLIDQHRPVLNRRVAVPERQVELPKCILLLPSAQEGIVKLYFLSGGAPLLEQDYRPGIDISSQTRMLREERGYRFDPLKIIASTYLKRYEEHINVILFDLYGTDEGLTRVLDSHWRDRQKLNEERVRYIGSSE